MYRRASLPYAGAARPDASSVDVVFTIADHYSAKIYTSGSWVIGHVKINVLRDTPFDSLTLSLVGLSTTQSFLQHDPDVPPIPFLNIPMPIYSNAIPRDRKLRQGRIYTIPFQYMIPDELPSAACKHAVHSAAVREQHLRPPPTMGLWEGDDQSPRMTQIKYAVRLVATQRDESGPDKIIDTSFPIKVLPHRMEDPPMDIDASDKRYALIKAKTIRKAMIGSKLGRLTATTAQPRAIMLSCDGQVASGTSCRISLVFCPFAGAPPPKIDSISGRLVSRTYFDINSMKRIPYQDTWKVYELQPYHYTTSCKLFTLRTCLVWAEEAVDANWQRVMFPDDNDEPEDEPRRDSMPMTEPSQLYKGQLNVEFNIAPNNRKVFLPTFHSCFISRVYTLELNLSVSQTYPTITLVTPLQIGVHARREMGRGRSVNGLEYVDSDHDLPSYFT